MTLAAPHRTKTELAVHLLRRKLLNGDLLPGDRLRVAKLTDEFAMSPTPIREALRILQADGLVTYRPHHAILVTTPAHQDIDDIVRLRQVLEPFAVALAIPRLPADTLAALEELHADFLHAVVRERGTVVTDLNEQWHWLLYTAAGSAILNAFIQQLWDRYPWRTMWALPGRLTQSAKEHSAVMEAIRRNDSPGAAEAMRDHIGSGEASLTQALPGQLA